MDNFIEDLLNYDTDFGCKFWMQILDVNFGCRFWMQNLMQILKTDCQNVYIRSCKNAICLKSML